LGLRHPSVYCGSFAIDIAAAVFISLENTGAWNEVTKEARCFIAKTLPN
jgi:hypothetical protein